MAEHSNIEWTDATWPIVAGCEFVSPECTNCYALNDSWRMAHNPNPKIHNAFFGTVDKTEKGHLVWSGIVRTLPLRLGWPLGWKAPRRIFVCNLADLFHPKVPFEFIAAAWCVMLACPQHTFQVLTKHPERMQAFLTWLDDRTAEVWNKGADPRSFEQIRESLLMEFAWGAMPGDRRMKWLAPESAPVWPLPNVHLGVTAGDQKRADERLAILLRTVAAKHFLSYEPAIGPLNLEGVNAAGVSFNALRPGGPTITKGLDWVIAGGESGARARAPNPDWFRKVRDDCDAAGVPFHFKQWGAWIDEKQMLPDGTNVVDRYILDKNGKDGAIHDWRDGFSVRIGKKAAGRYLDGRTHDGRPE